MIVIKLVGGLASQLHKYAVISVISKKYNKEFKVDLSAYDNLSEDNVITYDLPNLGMKPSVASYDDVKKAKGLTFIGRVLYFFVNLFSKIPFLGVFSQKVLNRLEFMDLNKQFITKSCLSIHVSKYTSLDWVEKIAESENVFIYAEFGLRFDLIESVRGELRNKITNIALSDNVNSYLEKIKKSVVSLSMHVRRGDYVSNEKVNQFHGTCTKEYYKEALSKYKGTDNVQLFVFSDDLEWVKSAFKEFLPENSILVSGNKNFEDFTLMVNCTDHIVANSGFSSVSAWLSGTEECNVTSPAKWFLDDFTNKSQMKLLPKGWNYL